MVSYVVGDFRTRYLLEWYLIDWDFIVWDLKVRDFLSCNRFFIGKSYPREKKPKLSTMLNNKRRLILRKNYIRMKLLWFREENQQRFVF